jgi:hypothetical protein
VVASKVPLPNYRPDLDDKRPQREVCLLNSMGRSCLTCISICYFASAERVFIIYSLWKQTGGDPAELAEES